MPKRKKTKKRNVKIKKSNFFARGSITLVLLLGIIIVGSVYFVRGALPDLEHIDIGERRVVVPSEEQEEGGNAEDSLQLRTIQFEACAETAAVTMQLDITGSMSRAIGDLKGAVIAFTNQLSDESVIGIQAYSTRNARLEVIPVSLYKDVKNDIRPEIEKLDADGRTPSHTALEFSREILEGAISQYPNREFSFIFFSDGNPNEPTSELTTPQALNQVASEIENLGVTIYAIGLGNINREIIEAVATSPDTAFYTTDSSELENIYSQISTDLCESVNN